LVEIPETSVAAISLISSKDGLVVGPRPLLLSDIPIVPSSNHTKTSEVLNQVIDSDIFSSNIRDFIKENRGKQYDPLCSITNNGDLVLP